MTFIAHAVARADHASDWSDVPAMGGGSLRLVKHADLVGIASAAPLRLEADEIPPTPVLRGFQRVSEALFARGPIAPFRFSIMRGGEEELARFLACRADLLRAVLERVAGCAEMSVRIPAPADTSDRHDAAPTEPTGASYLRSRAADRRSAEQAPDWLESIRGGPLASLGEIARASLAQGPSEHVPFGSLHYLVEMHRLAEFSEAFRAAWAGEERTVILSGPWPPYSFCA